MQSGDKNDMEKNDNLQFSLIRWQPLTYLQINRRCK